MAYVNQEKKAKIAAALKNSVPKGWKYSLAVRNHSTIVMTIRSAPIDLLKIACAKYENPERESTDINHYHLEHHFEGELRDTFGNIIKALNVDNFDESDSQTDYFHVGHYVNLRIGAFDKPFTVSA